MDSTGKYVASAGDRQIRVFHNVAGEFFLYLMYSIQHFVCRIKRFN